jgi:hypothetical protein
MAGGRGARTPAMSDMPDYASIFDEYRPGRSPTGLDSVVGFVRLFVSVTDFQACTIALWAAHTHAIDAFDCTPYLAVNSAEKQSGKTRLLEVLDLLTCESWLTGRVTAAVLIRKVEAVRPTLLLDESDAAFGSEKEYAEALRGVLNTGYRRSGKASCCVGQGANVSYRDFQTFCPKAIAGIGKLPDTVADRSIPIRLRRAKRGETGKFRRRMIEAEAQEIKTYLARWCAENIEKLRHMRPAIPEGLSDRQADCCEPLLAIADLAGGDWPTTARRALVALCAEAQDGDQSIGIRLLADIKVIFEERGVDRISSTDLVEALRAIETSPWAEWSHGKSLTAPKLARLLGRFEVMPGTIRMESKTLKGYYREDFQDAFSRYLPPIPPPSNRNNVTSRINTGENDDLHTVTGTSCDVSQNCEIPNKTAGCDGVTVSNPESEGGSKKESSTRSGYADPLVAKLPPNGSYIPDAEGPGCRCKDCGAWFGSIGGWKYHLVGKRCDGTGR